jgi:hypothetical protein
VVIAMAIALLALWWYVPPSLEIAAGGRSAISSRRRSRI